MKSCVRKFGVAPASKNLQNFQTQTKVKTRVRFSRRSGITLPRSPAQQEQQDWLVIRANPGSRCINLLIPA